jgi:hypothetical protein
MEPAARLQGIMTQQLLGRVHQALSWTQLLKSVLRAKVNTIGQWESF